MGNKILNGQNVHYDDLVVTEVEIKSVTEITSFELIVIYHGGFSTTNSYSTLEEAKTSFSDTVYSSVKTISSATISFHQEKPLISYKRNSLGNIETSVLNS